jgi:type IV pilus assembly protein PilA
MYRQNEKGFTLLELLATLTIISILTMIAIPQYEQFRERGYDAVARVDLRNVAIAEEAYFYDTEQYLACENSGCTGLPGVARLSAGTAVTVTVTGEAFTADATHARGTGKRFRWESGAGGMRVLE